MQIDRTTAKEEWLAEILSRVKPVTQQQRDVLIPAFRRGAQAHAEQQRIEAERSADVLMIHQCGAARDSAPAVEVGEEKADAVWTGLKEES